MLKFPASFLSKSWLIPNSGYPEQRTCGRGEAEAIRLAKETAADILLIDDRKARTAATRLGVKCTGLLGLVVHAKLTDNNTSLRAMIELLETQGGLYLSAEVKAEALRIAGE